MEATVLSVLLSVFGVILSVMLGLVVNKLNTIQDGLEKVTTNNYAHVTASHVHEAGFARVEEQIKNLLQAVQLSHERIDHIEAKL